MTSILPPSYERAIELSDANSWANRSKNEVSGAVLPIAALSSNSMKENLVPLDLENHGLDKSPESSGPSTPRSWIDRALRINTSAGDMTRPRAVTLVSLSFFFVLTTSLLVTGFQGILPALLKDGVYANLCPVETSPVAPSEAGENGWMAMVDQLAQMVEENQGGVYAWRRMSGPVEAKGSTCDRQRLRLNLMLTVSVTVLNLVCFPLGLLVDKNGPRWVGLGGSLVTIVGSMLFAFSDSRKFDMYIPAYALIGVGGVAIFMSLLHLLNVFPEHRGLLTTLYTATEDASTGVFYFFRRLHKAGISLRTLFLSYCAIPVAHFLVILLQPRRVVINEKTEKSTEFYPVSLQPLRKQALSLQYIAVVLWNAIMGVTTYFYLSTLNSQLIWLFGSQERADFGTEVFSFLFMVCPFVAVPFTGWIIDAFGTWPSLLFVALQSLIYGGLASVNVWWLQYFAWGTFVITRASFIGVSAHWVNQMFGENFTSLVGFMWTIGGMANFTNQLWVYIAITVFKSNFLIMNLIMTTIAVSSTLVAAFIVRRSLGERGDSQPLSEAALSFSVSEDSLTTLTHSSSDEHLSPSSTDSE